MVTHAYGQEGTSDIFLFDLFTGLEYPSDIDANQWKGIISSLSL